MLASFLNIYILLLPSGWYSRLLKLLDNFREKGIYHFFMKHVLLSKIIWVFLSLTLDLKIPCFLDYKMHFPPKCGRKMGVHLIVQM